MIQKKEEDVLRIYLLHYPVEVLDEGCCFVSSRPVDCWRGLVFRRC